MSKSAEQAGGEESIDQPRGQEEGSVDEDVDWADDYEDDRPDPGVEEEAVAGTEEIPEADDWADSEHEDEPNPVHEPAAETAEDNGTLNKATQDTNKALETVTIDDSPDDGGKTSGTNPEDLSESSTDPYSKGNSRRGGQGSPHMSKRQQKPLILHISNFAPTPVHIAKQNILAILGSVQYSGIRPSTNKDGLARALYIDVADEKDMESALRLDGTDFQGQGLRIKQADPPQTNRKNWDGKRYGSNEGRDNYRRDSIRSQSSFHGKNSTRPPRSTRGVDGGRGVEKWNRRNPSRSQDDFIQVDGYQSPAAKQLQEPPKKDPNLERQTSNTFALLLQEDGDE
ncbi:hypothetical protein NDN08_004033 [Rhodosorus marinus]|uniref:RRM domain-containing protein n=1 Tax=Rhodosorus marinus TaxID=101924 RepID=A0AAV8UJS9_9RHOD|nr:hypothetical protein NDN08_004033 [Rhodosorus marinus]